jgi:hypothetical protein
MHDNNVDKAADVLLGNDVDDNDVVEETQEYDRNNLRDNRDAAEDAVAKLLLGDEEPEPKPEPEPEHKPTYSTDDLNTYQTQLEEAAQHLAATFEQGLITRQQFNAQAAQLLNQEHLLREQKLRAAEHKQADKAAVENMWNEVTNKQGAFDREAAIYDLKSIAQNYGFEADDFDLVRDPRLVNLLMDFRNMKREKLNAKFKKPKPKQAAPKKSVRPQHREGQVDEITRVLLGR